MKLEKVKLDETDCFSSTFTDYINEKEALKPFYGQFPKIENFKNLLETRQLSTESRNVLTHVLATQYGPLKHGEAVDFNIHSLANPMTFTVTTGHQLNIFTGPLYFIYKIVTVINACQQLKAAYPEYHFVPVYWMASEDHDLEEISHFNLFGKKYQWNTDQTGPVGSMKPHSLNQLIDELPERVPLFEKAYLDFDTLADAVRFYVNQLFGDQGLVVIDADSSELKKLFAPIIKADLLKQQANELVKASSEKLNAAGYKNQAFSREINFFYMEPGKRERIVQEGEVYKVLNTDMTFTEAEILTLLEVKPECFSPNVIMRPLYQEMILPNLAYAGGPSEIAYWFQLKDVFDHHQVFFPALMPRVFGMIVNKAIEKKVQKLKLADVDLFKPAHQLKADYLQKNSDGDYDLKAESAELETLFEKIKTKGEEIDPTLVGFIGAEGSKALKLLENISKRLKKSEERNNDTAMSQIDNIKEKLFPNNGLQERHDNFLNFYLNNPEFVKELLGQFDAFAYEFHVLHDA